jgi:hypothetical protein
VKSSTVAGIARHQLDDLRAFSQRVRNSLHDQLAVHDCPVRDQELEAGEEQNWVEPFRVATLRREAISSRNQSAGAGDAPRGVASRARSRRQLECSGVPRVKPSCSHFLVCAANGFVELSPGKQPDSRTADAVAMAMRMVRRTEISGWAPLRPEMGLGA